MANRYQLNIVADENIPYLDHLEAAAHLTRLPGDRIDRRAIAGADALLVRTRTRCDRALLEGSPVRFVGTATIGTDHIDLDWCRSAGIVTANAPGSNAPAVAQYVFAAMARLANRPLPQYTLGIVGAGHVGSIVGRWARSIDMPVLLCDPPRAEAEGSDGFVSLGRIAAEADIITFHTPLTASGPWPTRHLAGEEFFGSLRRAPIVINSARGPVADTRAWTDALRRGLCGAAVVDCWEGEPHIDPELLRLAAIATPHIAGYSAPGKWRATAMVLDALCDSFGIGPISPSGAPAPPVARAISLAEALRSYDPTADTAALRADPDAFERLRNGYRLRPEARECFTN